MRKYDKTLIKQCQPNIVCGTKLCCELIPIVVGPRIPCMGGLPACIPWRDVRHFHPPPRIPPPSPLCLLPFQIPPIGQHLNTMSSIQCLIWRLLPYHCYFPSIALHTTLVPAVHMLRQDYNRIEISNQRNICNIDGVFQDFILKIVKNADVLFAAETFLRVGAPPIWQSCKCATTLDLRGLPLLPIQHVRLQQPCTRCFTPSPTLSSVPHLLIAPCR